MHTPESPTTPELHLQPSTHRAHWLQDFLYFGGCWVFGANGREGLEREGATVLRDDLAVVQVPTHVLYITILAGYRRRRSNATNRSASQPRHSHPTCHVIGMIAFSRMEGGMWRVAGEGRQAGGGGGGQTSTHKVSAPATTSKQAPSLPYM